ncbi:MAG: hypothetical protein EXS05_04415 [Planctomycetaceae bacterium]|nr:hypothetical protein [Planctomycetaceae bacterium]
MEWLKRWTERILCHLQNDKASCLPPSIYLPEAFADDALIRYSVKYPAVVKEIREAVATVKREHDAFDERSDDVSLPYAMESLLRKLRTVIGIFEEPPPAGVPSGNPRTQEQRSHREKVKARRKMLWELRREQNTGNDWARLAALAAEHPAIIALGLGEITRHTVRNDCMPRRKRR